MSISVASYLMGIPPANTNVEKTQIITNFVEGVWACGDKGTIVCDYNVLDVDVAVVQGFVHPGSKNMPHLNLRKEVFEHQKARGKRSIIVDSNLFLSYDLNNSNKFLRYSYDGVFPNTGEYCNQTPDPKRWDYLSKKIGIKLKPWGTEGKHILICCQRSGGWSMEGQQLIPWIIKMVRQVRKYSDRPIVIRLHPGDRLSSQHRQHIVRFRLNNVKISNSPNLLEDLKNAYAVINHNSSPGVVAAIEGKPLFLTDPERSQAGVVANTDLSRLETPLEFDRESWIQRMAQMHWTLDELKDGTAWRHLRQWAIK